MLRRQQSDMIVQTGPGTPGGQLFRSYWLPVLLAKELPENESPPVRVKILSERLVAFRDSKGHFGLIDEFCAHRGVSLWFGRNEESGLRCPYHGWKYDVTGQCIDVPSEPGESGFCNKIKLKSYPLIEKGGVLWTYMGPADKTPPEPEWEFATVPLSHSFVSKRLQECNWLQAMEGGIDSSHVLFLHSRAQEAESLYRNSSGSTYTHKDSEPQFEVVESGGGLYIGARRNTHDGNYYWRITQWVMPCGSMIPPRGDNPAGGYFWIPIDDENCMTWGWDYHPARALTADERHAMESGKGRHVTYEPGTWRAETNRDNNYLIDRAAQKAGRTYSGVTGFAMQDSSIQESMGPIVDRTKENLISTDNAIIMARHRLGRAIKALMEEGTPPPGVAVEHQKVRAVEIVLRPDQALKDSLRAELFARTSIVHASV